MPLFEFLLLFLIVGFAGFTQGVAGLGAAFILIPLLSLFFGIKEAIPLVNFLATSANVYLFIRLLRHTPWRKLAPFFIVIVPAMILGACFLKIANPSAVQIFLGAILLPYSLYSLFFKPRPRKLRRCWDYITPFAAGFTGGAVGAASPPVLIYVTIQPWEKDFTKSFLVSYFSFCGVIAFFAHTSLGLVTSQTIFYFLITIPVFIFTTWIGHLFYQKINETLYRKIIIALILLLGLLMLQQGIF